jgi:hypothetical protein
LAAFLVLICIHGALVTSVDALPEAVAPAIAGTVYLPLWLLQAIGLPVFGRAASAGWAGPSLLGWVLAAVIWAALWWLFVAALAKVQKGARKRAGNTLRAP